MQQNYRPWIYLHPVKYSLIFEKAKIKMKTLIHIKVRHKKYSYMTQQTFWTNYILFVQI